MIDNQTYEIFYDKEADLLELYFGGPTKAAAEEIEKGVFVRRDRDTGEVKSLEIIGFKKRVEVLKKVLENFIGMMDTPRC